MNVALPSTNIYEARAPDAAYADLLQREAERLDTMDALQAAFLETQLTTAFEYAREIYGEDTPISVLDIGAAKSTRTEEVSAANGAEYYALDINQEYLDGRSTDQYHKIRSDAADLRIGEDYPLPDGAFLVTTSRAVVGWNTAKAERIVQEQLRVTAPGGAAIYGEFDWTPASAGQGSDKIPEIRAARNIMLLGLKQLGFNPYFGGRLGSMVQAATAHCPGRYHVVETRHQFPEGDYRDLFLQAAGVVLDGMQRAGAPGAGVLMRAMHEIESADNISIHLPDLVTYTVFVAG